MRVVNRDVVAVQRFYPQIYLACHTRHERRRASPAHLTANESSLLAHLADAPMRASALARHLGIGASTLSAALKRLTALGYIVRDRDAADSRAVQLRLSAKGERAMQAASVLETDRVRALLARLTPAERTRALDGLRLLADAARGLAVTARGLRGPRRAGPAGPGPSVTSRNIGLAEIATWPAPAPPAGEIHAASAERDDITGDRARC